MPVSSTSAICLVACVALAQGERPDAELQYAYSEASASAMSSHVTSVTLGQSDLKSQAVSRNSTRQETAGTEVLMSEPRAVATSGAAPANRAAARNETLKAAMASTLKSETLVSDLRNTTDAQNPIPQVLVNTSERMVQMRAIGTAAHSGMAMMAAAMSFLETGSEILATRSHSLLEASGIASESRVAEKSNSRARTKRRGLLLRSMEDDMGKIVDDVVGEALRIVTEHARSNGGTCPEKIWTASSEGVMIDPSYAYGVGCKVACSCPWEFAFTCSDDEYVVHAPQDAHAAVTRLLVHRLGHCKLKLRSLCILGCLLAGALCSCAAQSVLLRKLADSRNGAEVKISKIEGANFRG